MTCLITGSSGLLGGCLIERLGERGDEIRTLDLVPARPGSPASAHTFFEGNVCDEARVEEAARGVDVIYHLAAAQRMKPQFDHWSEKEIFARNLGGVSAVLSVAERLGIPKVVHISSSGVYGVPRSNPVREDHPNVPLGEYGRSKLAAEGICLEAVQRGLDVTMLRPMSLFGPEMSGIYVMLFEWVRRGKPVFMLGGGQNQVQAASAWDVVDACILAAERPDTRGGIFNIGAEPTTVPTVEGMVRALIEHAGTRSPLIRIPASLLRNAARALNLVGLSPIAPEHYILADQTFILDVDAAKERLGWIPRYDNVQMMKDAYDAYLAAGEAARPTLHPLVRLLEAAFPTRVAD
jgi:nucleoside-diphosphate-sugar epimerase